MKIHPKHLDEDVEIDMSPMIDMVFLLLIFFLVASTIIDEKVPVKVPAAAFSKVPDDITGRVVLSINKDGDLFYGLLPVTLDELFERLTLDVEADPEVKIQIRSDGEVKYEVNEKVIEVCAKAGAQDLIYSAYEE